MTRKKYYFGLQGLSQTIMVPVGTCKAIETHFEEVTQKLDLEITQRDGLSRHWTQFTPPKHIPHRVASETVFAHNRYVRQLYDDLDKWILNPPKEDYEEMTPQWAKKHWYGFSTLSPPYDYWVQVHVGKMQVIFDALQGASNDIIFPANPLTSKQAVEVIRLFSEYFDKDDIQLELPNNYTFLVTSDECYWCPSHGAWLWPDVEEANFDYEKLEIKDDLICPAEGCKEIIG